jgi:cell wall assembly regulator SMI1
VNEIWQRIERWLAANAPTVLEGLNPPATRQQIAETEQFLGITFPAELQAAYLRHDGQSQSSPWFLEGWEWLSLERIRDEWNVWKELLDGGDFDGLENDDTSGKVLTDWWNPNWIPLTYSGSGDHHCLDLEPGLKGTRGQIIEMWHDEGSRTTVANSFGEWLAAFADHLEAGEFVFSEEYGGLCREDEA